MELKFDLFLYYTAWICWHFNFAINVWDHKLLWYFIYKLWTLYNFCHAGCWHILLRIKKNVLPEACKMILFMFLLHTVNNSKEPVSKPVPMLLFFPNEPADVSRLTLLLEQNIAEIKKNYQSLFSTHSECSSQGSYTNMNIWTHHFSNKVTPLASSLIQNPL